MLDRLERALPFAPGLLLAPGAILLSRLPPLAGRGRDLALLLGAMTVLYLAALFLMVRAGRRTASNAPAAPRRAGLLALIVVVGLLPRLALVSAPPRLSDDVYRYLWDGRVALSGVNPFRYAPADTALAALRDPDWQRVNNPTLPTIYPPVAQAFFHLAARAAPGLTGLKLLLLLVDLALGLVLAAAAVRRAGEEWRLLLYWWHPLPMIEFAWSGHIDVLGMLALTLAVMVAVRPAGEKARLARSILAGALLGAAALVKFLAVAAAPFLAPRRPREAVIAAIAFALTAAVLYFPYLGHGVNALGSLGTYAAKWRSNDFFFAALLRPGTLMDQDRRLAEAKLYAAAFVGGVAVLVAALRVSPVTAATTVLGTAVLISPTVHPWYLAWLLPLIAFRFSAAWFYITLAALAGYQALPSYLAGGGWHESYLVKGLVMAPFVVVGVWEARRALRAA